MRGLLTVLVVIASSCGSKKEDPKPTGPVPIVKPRLTPELMPPGMEKLVLNQSTQEEVAAVLTGAEVGKMNYNDKDTVTLKTPTATAYLWEVDGKTVLTRLDVKGDGLCASYVKPKIAPLEKSEKCVGMNRVTGDKDGVGEALYCVATADGKYQVWVECDRSGSEIQLQSTDQKLELGGN